MNQLSLIIQREFLAKVSNKSFIVMTFLTPLLMIAMSLLIGYLTSLNNNTKKEYLLHDADGFLTKELATIDGISVRNFSKFSLREAQLYAGQNEKALLYVPVYKDKVALTQKVVLFSDESQSISDILAIEGILNDKISRINLVKAGYNWSVIEKSNVKSSLQLQKFSGEKSLIGVNEIKLIIGGGMGYLIMMFIIIYGNFVMRSVIEEKTSRIIEIIISSVKPHWLMLGKILGNALAGLLQFSIWFVVIMSGFVAISHFATAPTAGSVPQLAALSKIQPYIAEIMQLPLATLFFGFVFYFLSGYLLYSALYAAIGAAVDAETDSQQFLLPIILPLMLGIYVGFFTVMENPHGTVAQVFSMIPFTSPIVMLMRLPFGVPLWQIALSALLLIGSFCGTVWFAAKIYRIGILSYGKKPSWKDLYKWMKQA